MDHMIVAALMLELHWNVIRFVALTPPCAIFQSR
jgi:hypothetical protein